MQGRPVYTSRKRNFYALRNFSYTLPYTTLEVKPVFGGFSGYSSWSKYFATDVSKCSAWLLVLHKYSAAATDRESLSKPWPRPIVQDSLFLALGSRREQRREIERKRRERISDLEHALDVRGKRAGQLLGIWQPHIAPCNASAHGLSVSIFLFRLHQVQKRKIEK